MDNIKEHSNAVITNEQIVTKAQLINDVQRWVLAETQLKQLNEKVKQLREMKAKFVERRRTLVHIFRRSFHLK